ncbi:hypothetical protein [Ligilactobacillus sp. LYQ60]|uniref:hypothetical protein n=1 Tax=Ligilactobacillus sp. LYQ60 TaxID=3378799 RepID=UPI0038526C62
MINRTITVEYMINNETGKIGFSLKEIAEPGQHGWEVDCQEKERLFTRFTNKGKVSKPQRSSLAIINERAEELLQQELQIESEREVDTARALELVEIVDNAFMNTDKNTKWVTIKTKTSHSAWYRYGGQLHTPSLYLTQVPASVEEQARELQSIRRKHQNDSMFDFNKTSYLKQEIRIADHDNGGYY